MKIVIDIPESKYLSLMKCFENDVPLGKTDTAIINGTPLPKGHGALKDADALREQFRGKEGDEFTVFHFYDAIDDIPTIIEADKEGAEE